MSIQQRHVDRLKEVYRQEFKRNLSNTEAWEMAYRLMDFIDVLVEASTSTMQDRPGGWRITDRDHVQRHKR